MNWILEIASKYIIAISLAVSNDATHSPSLDLRFAFKFTMQQIHTSKWDEWNSSHVLKTDMVKEPFTVTVSEMSFLTSKQARSSVIFRSLEKLSHVSSPCAADSHKQGSSVWRWKQLLPKFHLPRKLNPQITVSLSVLLFAWMEETPIAFAA